MFRLEKINMPNRSELSGDTIENYILSDLDSSIEVRPREDRRLDLSTKAPQDLVQNEKVSDVISNCEKIKYENWITLEMSEKESVLNALEHRVAEIECRPACPVRLLPLEDGLWGGYNPATKDITINSDSAGRSDFETYREIVDTLVHEGRHAYQDYNVNVCEIHPRHSEVSSWADCMEGGKWGYWGDCSTLLGQRLYDQQSIEIDARNFASDVLEKLNLNA